MFKYTIFAPATAMVKQAISIIRMSGEDSYKIINNIFSKKITQNGNQVYYGYLKDNQKIIDQVILICFEKPNSFTGEDLIEINCHGGVLITNNIIKLLIKNGAQLANKGEFLQRAFLNGKLNLIQTDAVNNLINATNDSSIKISLNNLQNKNIHLIKNYRDELLNIITNIEVNIDFPEYDGIGDLSKSELKNNLLKLKKRINNLIKISKTGKIINDGINILILGKPNVGKSSLLNALINENKAIVSEFPGTTRDIVEGKVNLGNSLTLNIIDTAGLHKTIDKIEQIGIKKTYEQVTNADLILIVSDNYFDLVNLNPKFKQLIKNKKYLLILNKIDLPNIKMKNQKSKKNIIFTSALNKNIKQLINKILNLYDTSQITKNDQLVLLNIEQISLLEKIEILIKNAYNNINKFPIDIINVDLHKSWKILGDILGESYEDDLLTTIFSKYCLGK